MLKVFKEALRVSSKRFFLLPWECLHCWSSPHSSFWGSRWSGMRTTCPAQRSCGCINQDGVDAGLSNSSEYLSVWDLVLPLYSKKCSVAGGVDRPRFTAKEQCSENYCPVHLDLLSRGVYGVL
eukprot:TRINITY_DN73585_c0_g1_i1.p1 TRINITY_DN73585_c0_g1~~TRINITY_DN73585_c0_g1_i1.p1  ORF type:complete len:123 (-),score=2.72 TRINITY_DN73585_c0_g1_i1:48-416(-)